MAKSQRGDGGSILTDVKLCYKLPAHVLERFDRECEAYGLIKSRVLAAAILHFTTSDATERARMFEELDAFVRGER